MAEEGECLWEAWRTRGDARAFEDLVRPELGRAVALARSEGCPPDEAEDAVQESLVRLARERSDAPARVGVRGWFFSVVRDRARSRLRSDRRRRRREHEAAVPEAAPGEAPRFALREEVDRALAGLPDEEQEALRLRYLLDLEYREVAYVLGVSEGACRMRVLRALKRIRGTLGAGAGAALAAVVFPAPANASTLVSSAVAAAPASAVPAAGGILLMTTMQKVVLTTAIAALLGGVLGAGVARQFATVGPSPPSGAEEGLRAEVASLRAELAKARSEAALTRSPETVVTPTPDPAKSIEGASPTAKGIGAGLRVRARDPQGLPMPGLRVQVRRVSGGGVETEKEGETDATGTATFLSLREGDVQVELNKEGTVRTTNVRLFKEAGVKDVEFRFPTCIPVTGVVQRAGLGPLADVYVHASFQDSFGWMAARTKTDAAGRYRVQLPPGQHSFSFSGKGISSFKQHQVDVPDGATEVQADFVVGVLSLRGSIRHWETRQPIRGVELILQGPLSASQGEPDRRRVPVDDDGGFSCLDLPAGKYRLQVGKQGFVPMNVDAEVPDGGPATEAPILLSPPIEGELEVLAPDGRPQSGPVNVSLWIPKASYPTTSFEAFCDENGVARLTQLLPGESRMYVHAQGVGTGRLDVTVTARENRFRIQLARE